MRSLMPDLTTEVAMVCSSNVEWQTEVVSSRDESRRYVVRWSRTPGGAYQFGWTCECPGFQYRGRCRHVRQVDASGDRCAWNDLMDPTAATMERDDGERVCPRCEGPLEPMMVAV